MIRFLYFFTGLLLYAQNHLESIFEKTKSIWERSLKIHFLQQSWYPLTSSFRNFDYIIGFKTSLFSWFRRLVDSDNGIGRMFKSTNYHCANLCRRFCTRRFHFRLMLVTVTRTNWHYENRDCQSTRYKLGGGSRNGSRTFFLFFSSTRRISIPIPDEINFFSFFLFWHESMENWRDVKIIH